MGVHCALLKSLTYTPLFWNTQLLQRSFEIPLPYRLSLWPYSWVFRFFKIPNLYKNTKLMQKYQTYAKIPNLCKNTKLMQKYQTYAALFWNTQLMQRFFETPDVYTTLSEYPTYPTLFWNTPIKLGTSQLTAKQNEIHCKSINTPKYTVKYTAIKLGTSQLTTAKNCNTLQLSMGL